MTIQTDLFQKPTKQIRTEILEMIKTRPYIWHSASRLSVWFNLSERQIRTIINELRNFKDPDSSCIISGDRGYKWAESEQEYEQAMHRNMAVALNSIKAIYSGYKAYRKADALESLKRMFNNEIGGWE